MIPLPEEESPATYAPVSAPIRVLIAENRDLNPITINFMRRDSSFWVIKVNSSMEALATFRNEPVEVVLMYLRAPIGAHLSAIQAMRAWEMEQGRRRTTIVGLVAHIYREELKLCVEAGCDVVFAKPFGLTRLIETIRDLTGQNAHKNGPDNGRPGSVAAGDPMQKVPSHDHVPLE